MKIAEKSSILEFLLAKKNYHEILRIVTAAKPQETVDQGCHYSFA